MYDTPSTPLHYTKGVPWAEFYLGTPLITAVHALTSRLKPSHAILVPTDTDFIFFMAIPAKGILFTVEMWFIVLDDDRKPVRYYKAF